MTNQEQNYTNGTSYTVNSAAMLRVDFGSIDLPSMGQTNAILVEFRGGYEYIYLCVPQALYEELESNCVAHCESNGGVRLGALFNEQLFRNYPFYARIHTP